MQHDEVIWTVISQNFCSFKVKYVCVHARARVRERGKNERTKRGVGWT